MKQYLLLTSALVLSSGVAEAACIQTPTCGAMGYDSTVACEGGIKCPFGNAWNCTLADKIAQLEITIEKLEQTAQQEALAKCKIGDILYHDMSCNANVVASKTPIGVIFDVTNGLAVAKDEFTDLVWGTLYEDISGIQNYASVSTSTADWQGFNNTKAMYEHVKSRGGYFSAMEQVLFYSTEGTLQGQWYLPAAGEFKAISDNKDKLNEVLTKIGGQKISGNYWTSSEQNAGTGYYISIGGNIGTSFKADKSKVRPIINFASKNKIEVNFDEAITCGVGSILYFDKKCYISGLLNGKSAIGVVFDGNRNTAIALEGSTSSLQWSSNRVDVLNLKNYENSTQAIQDFNGKANTAAIKAYNSSLSDFPAAKYAYNYTTAGTNVGDWYLPAAGEMHLIYQNKLFLNYTLSKLGKPELPTNIDHWSSSEENNTFAFEMYLQNGKTSFEFKDFTGYVRPVLAF